jgi:hypothetical protein
VLDLVVALPSLLQYEETLFTRRARLEVLSGRTYFITWPRG